MPYIITFFETILYHLFLTCMDIECYKNLLLGCLKCCFMKLPSKGKKYLKVTGIRISILDLYFHY